MRGGTPAPGTPAEEQPEVSAPEREDEDRVLPFPRASQPSIDALNRARRMNVIHALFDADVTASRRRIRELRRETGRPLSLTSFVAFCLARAVAQDRSVQGYRRRGRLIVFGDVDIAVLIERESDGVKTPVSPHVVKAAQRKSAWDIQEEILAAKAEDLGSRRNRAMVNAYWHTPAFIRKLLWRSWLGSPRWRKRLTGTVGFSAVGMFGRGAAWGVPIPTFTLNITTGSIAERPALVEGRLEAREYLSITASFDHDIVDGAPAARFIRRFKGLIERGYGLDATPAPRP